MNATGAWQLSNQQIGSRDIVVAVLDTGILYDHPDIKGSGNILGGYDFVTSGKPDATDTGDACPDDPNPSDSWHGTHVAGTIGAVGTNNSQGMAGVAWQVSILPVRVLGKCGGTQKDIINGIYWAAGFPVEGVPPNDHPADIISMSLGGQGACEPEYKQAIDYARKAGAVVVVAAGNDAQDVKDFEPGGCPGVISVAASDNQGRLAYYSNYGAVTIMAPGGDIRVVVNEKGEEIGFLPDTSINGGDTRVVYNEKGEQTVLNADADAVKKYCSDHACYTADGILSAVKGGYDDGYDW